MNGDESEIRSALQGLRRAPVPPAPRIVVVPRVTRPTAAPWLPLGFAAALAIGVFALVFATPRSAPPPDNTAPLSDRLKRVDPKIDAVPSAELRELLKREMDLLRRELALAGT